MDFFLIRSVPDSISQLKAIWASRRYFKFFFQLPWQPELCMELIFFLTTLAESIRQSGQTQQILMTVFEHKLRV